MYPSIQNDQTKERFLVPMLEITLSILLYSDIIMDPCKQRLSHCTSVLEK